MRRGEQGRLWLMLAPSLLVVVGLFGGGLALGLAQSLNYMPIIGLDTPGLAAYRAILASDRFVASLLFTLYIALVSTVLSTVLAVACALVLREHFRGRQLLSFLFGFNLPVPHLVGAISMAFLLSQGGLLARAAYAVDLIQRPSDFPALLFDPYAIGIILTYVWKELPFVGVVALAILQSVGDEYEQVAQTLGADQWQRFRYVLLPLLLPGTLPAAILVFAFTFGAFEVPALLGAHYPSALPVLAYRSYTAVDLQARPEAMAMAMIIAALSLGLILLSLRLARRGLRHDARP